MDPISLKNDGSTVGQVLDHTSEGLVENGPDMYTNECLRNFWANIDTTQVDLSKLPSIASWKRDFTMETVLIEIRRYMAAPANKKLPQPAEGTNF
jgi:hypothetical protein